jgi:putative ABC transport system permease protein
MSWFNQVGSMIAMGLRSVPSRLGTSMVIVVGLAAVVAVLISALALAQGFRQAATKTGSTQRAIVLNSDTESGGSLTRENVVTLSNTPGVRKSASGEPVASAEALTSIGLRNSRTGLNAFVTVRGVGPQALALRPEMRIVEGRLFTSGAREVLVGRSVQHRLGGLAPGSTIPMQNGDWTVTGIFETRGDAHESELMTDATMLLDATRRNVFSSLTVALDGEGAFERFRAAVQSDPTLTVTVWREDEYFARASRQVSQLLLIVAWGIGGLMAFGAVFAALNTMYTTVSVRAGEIATLRAIGFGSGAVVTSVVIEAMLLALAGALIGALISWGLLDGSKVSAMSGVSQSQLTFGLQIGPMLLLTGVACGIGVAVIGGALAAVKAARIPVAEAFRMT